MQALRGLGSALIVCVVLCVFLVVTMGAPWTIALVASGVLGLAILAVVGTRTGEKELTADAAWRAAAPDLPPAADRRELEAAQAPMPGAQPIGPSSSGTLRRRRGGLPSRPPAALPGAEEADAAESSGIG